MKILDIAPSSDGIVLVQSEPGTGFESQIKQDAKERNLDVINISALRNEIYTIKSPKFLQPRDNSKLDELVSNSSIKPIPLFEGNEDMVKDGVYTQPLPKFLQPRDNSKLDKLVSNSSIKPIPLFEGNEDWPEVKGLTAWIVNDFEKLTKEKQIDFFNKLSEKIKENKDLKVIVSFNDPVNISAEVLESASLVLDASRLQLIVKPIDFLGLPKVDLSVIRKKYNSSESENKKKLI